MDFSLGYSSRPLIDFSPHQKILWTLDAWDSVQKGQFCCEVVCVVSLALLELISCLVLQQMKKSLASLSICGLDGTQLSGKLALFLLRYLFAAFDIYAVLSTKT